jgi:hypothetical protein
MTNTRVFMVAVVAGGMLLAGGCKQLTGGNCNKPQAYAAAEEIPPLRIPVGLDGPDTRAALKVPPLDEPEAPRGVNDPCLDAPPPAAAPVARPR